MVTGSLNRRQVSLRRIVERQELSRRTHSAPSTTITTSARWTFDHLAAVGAWTLRGRLRTHPASPLFGFVLSAARLAGGKVRVGGRSPMARGLGCCRQGGLRRVALGSSIRASIVASRFGHQSSHLMDGGCPLLTVPESGWMSCSESMLPWIRQADFDVPPWDVPLFRSCRGWGESWAGTSRNVDHDLAGVVMPLTGWPTVTMPIR